MALEYPTFIEGVNNLVVGSLTNRKGETMESLQVDMQRIGQVLLMLAVLAVAFETALTPIFNWRIFARHFEGKGVKTPLTVFVAIVLLWAYDIDIFKEIVVSIDKGSTAQTSLMGRVLTGLLVAGGSDAVFRIFTRLGMRDPRSQKVKAKEEQEKKQQATTQSTSTTANPPGQSG